MSPVQLKIIAFWANFTDETSLSEEKRRFLAVWQTLGPVYRTFRERLRSLGMAYTGMVHRAAAERIKAGGFAFPESRRFVVAGFNALSECEKRLFKFLSTAAETDFYWDYDTYYTDNADQEAGMFLRENRILFPARRELPHDHFRSPKRIEAISTVSNAVQCKYVTSILRDLAAEQGPLGKETAVVLTDENLLLPLLHALPAEIGKVNVTMGYPLKQSLSYSFVERLIELQNHARQKEGKPLFTTPTCWDFCRTLISSKATPPGSSVCRRRSSETGVSRSRRSGWPARRCLLRCSGASRGGADFGLPAGGDRADCPDALRRYGGTPPRRVPERHFRRGDKTSQFTG